MSLSYYHDVHAKCDHKENQASSRVVLIEETHMNEYIRLKWLISL